MSALTTTAPEDLGGDDATGESERYRNYMARTSKPLDLVALATLWIVLVPPWDFGPSQRAIDAAWAIRIAVTVLYGFDLLIRSLLARRHLRYALTHPLAAMSVIFPPVRVIFSLRLVRSVFQRGNMRRFLLAAGVMVLDFAIVVLLYERHAAHSNIHTIGDALWWAFVTVTTVGYGDFFPVTPQGRLAACVIMGIGILTLAVVTAQVASSFVTEERAPTVPPEGLSPEPEAATGQLAELNDRLARIEAFMVAMASHTGLTPDASSGPAPPSSAAPG